MLRSIDMNVIICIYCRRLRFNTFYSVSSFQLSEQRLNQARVTRPDISRNANFVLVAGVDRGVSGMLIVYVPCRKE
jgi:hypothetical protein